MLERLMEEARGLSAAELERAIEGMKALVLVALAGPEGEPERCPHCGCPERVRRGVDRRRGGDGRVVESAQRWLCRGCGRSYTRRTLGLLSASKLGPEKWSRFVELMAGQSSLARCADELGVSERTAHFMRARACEVLAAATPPMASGPDVQVQVDGTYLNESMSGMGLRGGAGVPREPHSTGHDVRSHGISNEKVCVLCGVNDAGDAFAVPCDRGRPSAAAVAACLRGRVAPGTVLSTDGLGAYDAALPAVGVTNHLRFPSDGSAGDGLWRVNNLHRRLDDFLRPFNGVSTRYLHLYLMWFVFNERARRSGACWEDEVRAIVARGRYRTTRRELYGAPRPFWDYWEEAA